ncbi:LapA family protein [Zhihengliuella flava]|uniref:Integral membrane protein n=1 Tax=Zhihengliuella flava TaxID=1285193 RepID=A0A931GFR7_9MICC|nr:lipopolysaccharide assembly protein LapA domain-containing protein [Zhihengliuella flava]MBG6084962.1 putative integral membrane protein [Zhihengliuella flava]
MAAKETTPEKNEPLETTGTQDAGTTPDIELAPTKQETPKKKPEETPAEYQDRMTTTRSGAIWATTIVSLIVLVLLIIFIYQNPQDTSLNYFGWSGSINVGVLVLGSAVAGGIIVALAGAARIIALKAQKRRQRKASRQQRG